MGRGQARSEGPGRGVEALVAGRGSGQGGREAGPSIPPTEQGLLSLPLSRGRTEESHATLSLSTCTSTIDPCSRLSRYTDTINTV